MLHILLFILKYLFMKLKYVKQEERLTQYDALLKMCDN